MHRDQDFAVRLSNTTVIPPIGGRDSPRGGGPQRQDVDISAEGNPELRRPLPRAIAARARLRAGAHLRARRDRSGIGRTRWAGSRAGVESRSRLRAGTRLCTQRGHASRGDDHGRRAAATTDTARADALRPDRADRPAVRTAADLPWGSGELSLRWQPRFGSPGPRTTVSADAGRPVARACARSADPRGRGGGPTRAQPRRGAGI